jgi:hypothetical protein
MEKLVVSLDIAKQLKAAGFPQETVFHWSHWQGKKSGIEEWHISGGWGWSNHTLPSGRTHHYYHEDSLAAPTAQELADVLPGRTWVGLFTEYAAKNEIRYKASKHNDDGDGWHEEFGATMADALALLYLKLRSS